MTDTIDLLEAIGSNASLRYASPGDLAAMLDAAHATDALKAAAGTGNRAFLANELGGITMHHSQTSQTAIEEEESEESEAPAPPAEDSLTAKPH